MSQPRRLVEIDGAERSDLDPRAIVLSSEDQEHPPDLLSNRLDPVVVWQGAVASDRQDRQATYYVRLYAGGSGHCSCADYYFRGLLRRQPSFRCKHLVRAWAAHGARDGSSEKRD